MTDNNALAPAGDVADIVYELRHGRIHTALLDKAADILERLAGPVQQAGGDQVERVARALARHDGIEICADAIYAMSSYGAKARAAIAAMQPKGD